MKVDELRALIRKSAPVPVRVSMDGGQAYPISHPDSGLVAESAMMVARSPGQDPGGASFAVCDFHHISRIESMEPKKAA